MAKLTKRDIQKTLEEIPVETLLTGKVNTRELTTKQKEFAKGLALGLPKSKAYRNAYDSKARPRVIATKAHNLAKRDDIQLIAKGFKEAFEAREYQKPAQIKELIIHNLLKMSLSDEVKDAQRIKSLELLGKLSEVSAWSETKTTTVIHESGKLKQKLIDQLQTIVHGEIKEVTEDEGDLLLRELLGEGAENGYPSDPTYSPPPQENLTTPLATTHINPHTQSDPKNSCVNNQENIVSTNLSSENNDMLTVNVYSEKNEEKSAKKDSCVEEGVGGKKEVADADWVEYREVPPSNLGTME